MSPEELKALQKEVSTRKRIATDCASKVHDLVEDRLWSAYAELPELARQTVEACEAWQAAKVNLEQAGG
ncbi:MAG: CCE_0567 family metalloprotein [Fluviicoccus sp.]|uniref:CCE_0567 family metalloprotein n=1 Tax=Fluviicoccus sp. TaxID=2003552 RepID=UPI002719C5DE|nr:CCE_0567 family metalloprotein [Fluviicoccus sp.]MDO8329478.1 CCE_0567 family metalloprotein [Fluviicoccus sp.]